MKFVINFNKLYISLLYHNFGFSISIKFWKQTLLRDFCFQSLEYLLLIHNGTEAKKPESTGQLQLGAVRTYHGRQGGVQAGFGLTVIGITVLITATVIDKADLQVHPTLQSGEKQRGRYSTWLAGIWL
jgi:hypothetical protein